MMLRQVLQLQEKSFFLWFRSNPNPITKTSLWIPLNQKIWASRLCVQTFFVQQRCLTFVSLYQSQHWAEQRGAYVTAAALYRESSNLACFHLCVFIHGLMMYLLRISGYFCSAVGGNTSHSSTQSNMTGVDTKSMCVWVGVCWTRFHFKWLFMDQKLLKTKCHITNKQETHTHTLQSHKETWGEVGRPP